jgi:hypothetical protein
MAAVPSAAAICSAYRRRRNSTRANYLCNVRFWGFSFDRSGDLLTVGGSLRSYLVLLDLAVRHDAFPDFKLPFRKRQLEYAKCHTSTFQLVSLLEFFGNTERPETVAKFLQRLVGEVTVAVFGQQASINFALLQASKNLSRLLFGPGGGCIGKQKPCDCVRQVA